MPTSPPPPKAASSAADIAKELREVNERLLLSSLLAQEVSEQARRRHQERLSALLEALHEGVLITDGTGRVLMLNVAARRLVGFTDETDPLSLESVDLRRLDMTPLAVDDNPIRRTTRGEAFVDEEVLLVRASGDIRHLMTNSTFTMEDGKVALAIVVFHDVTERRLLEARIAQTERLAALGTLAAGVAHEINNPLVSVWSNLELVLAALRASRADTSTAQLAQLVQLEAMLIDARTGAERIRTTVQALTTFARADKERHTIVALVPVLELSIRIAFNEIRHHARLVTDFGAVPDVEVDGARLGQVFVNLLVNAVHALDGGDAERDEIRVVTSTDSAGRAVIEVSDTGTGIPDDVLPRIFDPFFTTKGVGRGTGLGLSVSRNTVAAIGGEISVKSEPGHGTTFRVVLPPAKQARAAALPPPSGRVDDVETRRGIVLVVDDERSIGVLLVRILTGHDVTIASSADEALGLIASGRIFDVILSDIMMPGKSGIELYTELKATSPEHSERVVFISGGAFSPGANEFLEAMTNERIDKPFEASVVRSLVRRYVRARA